MPRLRRAIFGYIPILIAFTMLLSCKSIAERAADAVYSDLETYYDTEAPPTTTSFPASSSISSVIGGRGEGLSCSIPSLMQWAMFDRKKNDAVISLQFRQACVYHDYCYRHGHATYGYTRNVCDYALQQFAYRTCRLLGNGDPHDCMSQARRVLLGVTLGGGKSFASHDESSYFEFDPMPIKADDYVVARWVKTGEGMALAGKHLDGEFRIMHFKRGTVLNLVANFNPLKRDQSFSPEVYPEKFPGRFIPTPPYVVRYAEKDHLLAVARDNYQNTEIKVVEYGPSVKNPGVYSISEPAGYKSDLDASVFWFDKQMNDELSYWSYTTGFGISNVGKIKSNQILIHSNYRTLQHAPIEGRFFNADCFDTAVMKRGGPQTSKHDDAGEGYKEGIHLFFVRPPVSPCTSHAPLTLAADEGREPLVPIRLDNGRDILISVTRNHRAVELAAFNLAKADGQSPLRPAVSVVPSLNAAWLRIPPQVLFDAGDGSSILFFSRFYPVAVNKPNKARFDFKYFKLGANVDGSINLASGGSASCSIDLESQFAIVKNDTLGSNIGRSFRRTKDNEASIDAEIKAAILTDLQERWANAQVIPGWFFQRDGGKESGPLDVAVFFRGHANYSFIAQGQTVVLGKNEAGLESVAPSYVNCGSKRP